VGGGITGNSSSFYNDFYKWNQKTNSWSTIKAYPGLGSDCNISFSIEGYGYVAFGRNSSGVNTDMWRYDTGANTWTAMAAFPGAGRYDASVFVLGHKAYIIAGSKGGPPYLNDVWMYDAHQNSWKQLSNCPAGDVEGLSAFTIGNHGYIGGGWNYSNFMSTFWQYDTTKDSWTSIASIPLPNGLGGDAEAFVIGSKAYICVGWTGGISTPLTSGYVYDTVTKGWSTFTNMGINGIERYYSVAFAVGNNGYICAGDNNSGTDINDLWQWNPDSSMVTTAACGTWSQQANFTGNARHDITAFTIGHYAFVGGGITGSSSSFYNDFYKWNQKSNSWTAIKAYPGLGQDCEISFSIEGYGYVALGRNNGGVTTDVWRYDTGANTWTAMAAFPGAGRYDASVFVLGHKAYVVAGSKGGSPYLNDVWMYDAHQNSWKQMNNCPVGNVEGLSAFAIGNRGYIGGGWNYSNFLSGFWQYDTTNDSWSSIASIPLSGGLGGDAEAFVIGSKAYICVGWTSGISTPLTSGYVYDTVTKAWSTFTNMSTNGIVRYYSAAFAIGNDGYICAGDNSSGADINDLWQYQPCTGVCTLHSGFIYTVGANGKASFTSTSKDTTSTTTYYWDAGDGKGFGSKDTFTYTYANNGIYDVNLRIGDSSGSCTSDTTIAINIASTVNACNVWSKQSTYPGNSRHNSTAFTIGHYAFVGGGITGNSSSFYNDFYKWNQKTNSWSTIKAYPGLGSDCNISFSIEGYGYVAFGRNSSGVNTDMWRYDTGANTWTAMAAFPGAGRYDASVFVLGHKAYIIAGSKGGPPYLNDVWMYDAHQNSWKQLSNCPAGDVEGLSAFTIGNHGYIGGGWNYSNFMSTFWQYDTTKDSWTSIASIPLPNGLGGDAEAFVIGSKAYICVGWTGGISTPLTSGYVYDTVTKGWSTFTNMGINGIERYYSVAFAVGNNGYICAGDNNSGTDINDLWQYYPCSDTVAPITPCKTMHANFTYFTGSGGQAAFSSNSTGTGKTTIFLWDAGDGVGTGNSNTYIYTYLNNGTYGVNLHLADSTGNCTADTTIYVTIINATKCNLHAAFTFVNGSNGLVNYTNTSAGIVKGTHFYWNAGDGNGGSTTNNYSYTYAYNGTYGVNLYITDSIGNCSSDTTIYVAITNAVSCSLHADFSYTTGLSGQVIFASASAGMNSTTQLYWYAGDSIGYGSGNPYSYTYAKNGTYPVNLFLYNSNGGCSSDTTINVTITNANNSVSTCMLGMILQSSKASCDTCNNGSATATATSGTSPYTYSWSNGSTASNIIAKPGIYTCCVIDAKGCSACATTTVTDSCLYAEFTYSITYDTLGAVDSATITFISISDTVCADSSLYKTAQKNPKISYTWNFGDGNSQTISGIGVKTSRHTFVPGSYDITLAINREGSPTKSVTTKPLRIKKSGTLTGITSISESADVKLFPNPNNGSFRLTINRASGNHDAQLEVTNLLGEVVYATNARSANGMIQDDINLVNISAGTYFVRVITPGKVYNTKVVIAK